MELAPNNPAVKKLTRKPSIEPFAKLPAGTTHAHTRDNHLIRPVVKGQNDLLALFGELAARSRASKYARFNELAQHWHDRRVRRGVHATFPLPLAAPRRAHPHAGVHRSGHRVWRSTADSAWRCPRSVVLHSHCLDGLHPLDRWRHLFAARPFPAPQPSGGVCVARAMFHPALAHFLSLQPAARKLDLHWSAFQPVAAPNRLRLVLRHYLAGDFRDRHAAPRPGLEFAGSECRTENCQTHPASVGSHNIRDWISDGRDSA